MRFDGVFLALPVALAAMIAVACSGVDRGKHLGHQPVSQYAGHEDREIKAISESDIAALLNGDGMGAAKAAELNGYPGPKHALELSEPLELTSEQRSTVEAVYKRMNSEAVSLGYQLIEQERLLENGFRQKSIDTDSLRKEIERIGKLQGDIRNVHLQAHLEMMKILTPEQIARYNRLRGYKD